MRLLGLLSFIIVLPPSRLADERLSQGCAAVLRDARAGLRGSDKVLRPLAALREVDGRPEQQRSPANTPSVFGNRSPEASKFSSSASRRKTPRALYPLRGRHVRGHRGVYGVQIVGARRY